MLANHHAAFLIDENIHKEIQNLNIDRRYQCGGTHYWFSHSIVAWYQDTIVQSIVSRFNEDFRGALIIEDTDISPFSNFPYISIDIKNVQVFEDKADMFAPILDVSNTYLGLNFWALLKGDFKVNMLGLRTVTLISGAMKTVR
ncbi:MAG: hypothetical protein U5K79_15150 [Cyclobacteriaceae bacterium]|nr:hypothetical protein [Cyclobacteriaceae bacterium]